MIQVPPFFIDLTILLQAESIHITHRPNVTENHGRKKSHFCPVGQDFEMTSTACIEIFGDTLHP